MPVEAPPARAMETARTPTYRETRAPKMSRLSSSRPSSSVPAMNPWPGRRSGEAIWATGPCGVIRSAASARRTTIAITPAPTAATGLRRARPNGPSVRRPAPGRAILPRGLDVLLAEDREHRGARHPEHDRSQPEREGQNREEHLLRVHPGVLPRWDVDQRRAPAEGVRSQDDQRERDPEVRDREPQEADDLDETFEPDAACHAGHDPERQAEERHAGGAEHRELHGDREAGDEQRGDGLARAKGPPEVAVQQVPCPEDVLDRQRPVQPKAV